MGAQKAEQVDKQTTLVVGTLEQVAAASVRRLVLQRALDVARLDAIPNRVEDLTFFVSGPLYEAAQGVLGEEFADELLLELAPVLDRAWHDDRATVAPPSLPPSVATPPSLGELPEASGASVHGDPLSHIPTSNVRKRSAIHRVSTVEVAIGDDADGGERADTIPADDDDGSVAPPAPSYPEGSAGDTIPGAESGRPEDSGRGVFGASHDWTYTDAPPASSEPGVMPPPSVPQVTDLTGVEVRGRGHLRAVAIATRDETPPPPRSNRFTVPYLQAVLTPPRRRRRVMIIDAHDEPRRLLADALEKNGYAVVTAHDRGVARTLYHRLAPTLIIADVETVAPDFEPLGPAFEELLGGSPPSTPSPRGLPVPHHTQPPRVLLLSDGATRSVPPEVDCVVDRRTDLAGILHEVEGLLPLESQRPS